MILQGSPRLKRPLTKFLIFEKLRFRNGYIILMLIVKNRIILLRYEIWKLMSKHVKKKCCQQLRYTNRGIRIKMLSWNFLVSFPNMNECVNIDKTFFYQYDKCFIYKQNIWRILNWLKWFLCKVILCWTLWRR